MIINIHKQICRPNLFRRSMRRFNVAWWDYSFPITSFALVSTDYAEEVKGTFSHILMLLLLALSVLVSLALTMFTLLNFNMLLVDIYPSKLSSVNPCNVILTSPIKN